MNGVVLCSGSIQLAVLVSEAGERAGTANIRNPNTRQGYAIYTQEFLPSASSEV